VHRLHSPAGQARTKRRPTRHARARSAPKECLATAGRAEVASAGTRTRAGAGSPTAAGRAHRRRAGRSGAPAGPGSAACIHESPYRGSALSPPPIFAFAFVCLRMRVCRRHEDSSMRPVDNPQRCVTHQGRTAGREGGPMGVKEGRTRESGPQGEGGREGQGRDVGEEAERQTRAGRPRCRTGMTQCAGHAEKGQSRKGQSIGRSAPRSS